MTEILITGAAGFIGFHLKKILDKNNRVYGIDLIENIAARKRVKELKNVNSLSIHSDFLKALNESPDIIIHLAGQTGISGSLENPSLYFYQNVEGTFKVLEQCRKNGIKYLIYASSSSVYSPDQYVMSEDAPHNRQLSYYGTSKRMSETMVENYCQQFGLTAIGLRFFTVYGSWIRPDMAGYKFMKAIEEEQPITIYNNGSVMRDFTHVSDIVNALELLVEKIKDEKTGSHQVFNIGYGSPVSVSKYARLIGENLGKKIITQSAPLPDNELLSTYCDTRKLEAYIHYKPKCPVEKGVAEMTDWFKKNRYE